ncbi:DUF488 domain-containing protein [Methyloprofundus sedimenti]|nr:DUF488 domain-containing protein [Methyloprofundus sedimenti]
MQQPEHDRFRIKRVYELPDKQDGQRILVDRLWPRGLTKEKARVDLWLKDIAPSTELRKWFDHDPDRWHEFKARYLDELKGNQQQIQLLKQELDKGFVTLVYAAKDERYNQAVVIQENDWLFRQREED